MAAFNKYENYSVSQFVVDEYFIAWVKYPDDSNEKFWSDFQLHFPEKKKDLNRARTILNQVTLVQEDAGKEREERIWSDIHHEVERSDNIRKKPARLRRIFEYAAAASVVAVLIGGYYLLNYGGKKLTEGQQVVKASSDIAPGGNKAILTLADGSKIILDSANNGAITKQGNITVIKLNDGEIAYKSSTLNLQSSMVSYNTITTPRGGQYQLVLADGSKVWLNAESSLRFPTAFAGNERKVTLTGEGYFEVAHNANKPFRVSVNDMTVEVLGTHFNVNAYGDEGDIRTTLLEGSVEVVAGGQSVRIKPGEQARMQTLNHRLQTIGNIDLEDVVAWKNGRFQFNNATVEDIMKQASRWYDVDVSYQGSIHETFSGGLQRSESISQLFAIIEATGKVDFRVVGKQIIVVPK